MITSANDLYEKYMDQYGGIMPIDRSVAEEYFSDNRSQFDCLSESEILIYFRDYVGSQQLYEEGSEESW